MIPVDTFQTKSSQIYTALKSDITTGVYKPGLHLVRRDLVKRFGVSLSIVNEALGRLGNDGLVETKEMYGTRVIALSTEMLQEEFVLREAIERHVVRLLAENGADESFDELLEQARTLDRLITEKSRDDVEVTMLHLEFHLQLARATGYAALEETLKRSSMRALLTTRWIKNQRLPHPADFHEQLIRVIMGRNAALADQKMHEHLHFAGSAVEATPPEIPATASSAN
ncbi:MAG: GntR family transcriptional regulator [Opitutus sp.]|nr:GntR family transcriptional regulator [Opitutus sp.]